MVCLTASSGLEFAAACMVRASYILHMPIQGTTPYLLLAGIMAYGVQDRSIQQAPPVTTTV